jgi:acid phosphatase type 7
MKYCWAILALTTSCADDGAAAGAPDAGGVVDAGAVDAADPDPAEGGTLALESCGYSVTTRLGATAPLRVAATLGPDPAPRQVHLGLASDPARSMVVVWRTADDVTLATSVRFGKAAVTERIEEGFSFRYTTNFNGARTRMHEVHLCGLEPDTEYRYQAGGDGAWSPEYRFRTAPEGLDAQVTIGVLGDSRGGQDVWGRSLAKLVELGAPDLLLFTGDAVTLGQLQVEWDAFYDEAAGVLAEVPILFTNGNHESNAIAFYALAAMPGNESWYGLDYGPAHLTVLNDTPEQAATVLGAQRDFLRQDLTAAAAAPWKLLMHHKAMWSAGTIHGSNLVLRDAWGPLVDEHRVDLVLAGHEHNYERSKPLRGTEIVAAGEGTVFLVSGGAGAPLYPQGTAAHTAFSESTEGFVILDVRRGRLDGKAYRSDGTLMDSFSLTK